MEQIKTYWNYWLIQIIALFVVSATAMLVHYVIFRLTDRYAKRSNTIGPESIVKHCRKPSRLIFPLLAINMLLPSLTLPSNFMALATQLLSLALIISLGWMLIRLILVVEEILLSNYRIDTRDNLRARTVRTQILLLRKVLVVIVTILTLSVALMTFDKVRQLGTTLLASAGIAGIIVGIAAQRSIATLIAGVQMALTQPIREDDVVIVEGEWGRVEEITLTYVVIRIWDLRRLIVPTTYFLEKPFQNWTRVSAELLGTVFIYMDYRVPVDDVRTALGRICENSESWDGKLCLLQVTNCTDRTMELRALVSAHDSSSAWDLRCEVREELIRFVQEKYPSALPRTRIDIPNFGQAPVSSA